jgi:hypothetical protein
MESGSAIAILTDDEFGQIQVYDDPLNLVTLKPEPRHKHLVAKRIRIKSLICNFIVAQFLHTSTIPTISFHQRRACERCGCNKASLQKAFFHINTSLSLIVTTAPITLPLVADEISRNIDTVASVIVVAARNGRL